MISILIRILLVVFLSYYLSKILLNFLERNQISSKKKNSSSENKSSENYIDICPECGRVKEKNHRCP